MYDPNEYDYPAPEEMIARGYFQRESDGMWRHPSWAAKEAAEAKEKADKDTEWGEGEIRF